MGREIRTFKEFHLGQTGQENFQSVTENMGFPIEENTPPGPPKKEESYRNIAYKLSEIFGLYGFFFSLKEGFFDPKNLTKLMNQIIAIKDPTIKWDTIIKMSKYLQQKVSSLSKLPIQAGEFGARGQYDYGQETENLPKATEFLRSASNAAFKSFTPEEKTKSLEILDGVLQSTEKLSLQNENHSFITERQRFLPPSPQDLLRLADSIGAKLLNMYDMLDRLSISFPESKAEVETFQNSLLGPSIDKVRTAMEKDIPNIGERAAGGYYKKLQGLDKEVTALIPRADSLRTKLVSTFQPIAAASEFEDSAQKIIDEVRKGILKQAELNVRRKKATDVIAGTTDLSDVRYSGTPQAASAAKKATQEFERKRKNIDSVSDFLAKKYSPRG
jgi:hypothetical protein